jgi:hypothetical protein
MGKKITKKTTTKKVNVVKSAVDIIVVDIESYKLVDEETEKYEYDIKVNNMENGDIIYELFRSNAYHWSCDAQGGLCLSIVDNGNGIVINGLEKELDYARQHELRLLLTFIEKSCANMINYNVVNEKAFMKL